MHQECSNLRIIVLESKCAISSEKDYSFPQRFKLVDPSSKCFRNWESDTQISIAACEKLVKGDNATAVEALH